MKGIEANNARTVTSRKEGSPAFETIRHINFLLVSYVPVSTEGNVLCSSYKIVCYSGGRMEEKSVLFEPY